MFVENPGFIAIKSGETSGGIKSETGPGVISTMILLFPSS